MRDDVLGAALFPVRQGADLRRPLPRRVSCQYGQPRRHAGFPGGERHALLPPSSAAFDRAAISALRRIAKRPLCCGSCWTKSCGASPSALRTRPPLRKTSTNPCGSTIRTTGGRGRKGGRRQASAQIAPSANRRKDNFGNRGTPQSLMALWGEEAQRSGAGFRPLFYLIGSDCFPMRWSTLRPALYLMPVEQSKSALISIFPWYFCFVRVQSFLPLYSKFARLICGVCPQIKRAVINESETAKSFDFAAQQGNLVQWA